MPPTMALIPDVHQCQKNSKSNSTQRARNASRGATFDASLKGDVDIKLTSHEALDTNFAMLRFHDEANKDPVLEALFHAHNVPAKTRDAWKREHSDWEGLHDWHKELIGNRFLRAALERMIEVEGLPGPEGALASVSLKEMAFGIRQFHVAAPGPFEPYRGNELRSRQALFRHIAAAQLTVCLYGCTLEIAIELCMTLKPSQHKPADNLTVAAVEYLLSGYLKPPPDSIPVPHAQPVHINSVHAIMQTFRELDWRRVMQELRDRLADDIRREKGYSQDQELNSDDLPRFLKSKTDCQRRLTNAALRLADSR